MILQGWTLGYLACSGLLDWKEKRVSLAFSLAYLAGVVFLYVWKWNSMLAGIFTGIIVFILLEGIRIISEKQIGFGDVLLFGCIGIAIGPTGTFVLLWLSFFYVAVCGGILLISRRKRGKDRIPFVPFVFLAYGTILLIQEVGT